jgi:hypothetical protein
MPLILLPATAKNKKLNTDKGLVNAATKACVELYLAGVSNIE